jgi:hypothetical protein
LPIQEDVPATGDVSEQPYLTTALQATKGRLAALSASLAFILAITESATGFVTRLGVQNGAAWFRVAAAFVCCVGMGVYVRETIRIRRRGSPRPISVFLGADSFGEKDHSRFFGRETEIDVISRRLVDPRLNYLILYGESGSGKTSLIRAGLIPLLTVENEFVPVYVRLFERPEQSTADVLARLALPKKSPEHNSETASHTPTLTNLMDAARSATGKTIILFFDQFEEFFTLSASELEKQNF